MGKGETQCLENLAFREAFGSTCNSLIDIDGYALAALDIEMREVEDKRREAIRMATRAAVRARFYDSQKSL